MCRARVFAVTFWDMPSVFCVLHLFACEHGLPCMSVCYITIKRQILVDGLPCSVETDPFIAMACFVDMQWSPYIFLRAVTAMFFSRAVMPCVFGAQ